MPGLLQQPPTAAGGQPMPAGQGQMPPQAPPGAMPPQGQQPQGQPPAAGGTEMDQQSMQKIYEMLVGQTVEYIYGKGLPSIKERIQAGAEDGVEDDVGAVVGQLLLQNWQSAREAQKMIPPKVIAGACKELVEVVTEIAVEMQLVQPQQADAAADEALYTAIATFGQGANNNMSQQERQEFQVLIQQLEDEEAQAKGGGMPQQPPGAGGAPAPQQQPMPAGGQMPR